MLLLLMLLACTSQTPSECPECPSCSEQAGTSAGASGLAAWEAELLAPTLEEMRKGLQTWGDQPFGVCQGARDCDIYLGEKPGLLEVGSFFIRTELKAPAVGEGWKASFEIDCSSTDARGNTSEQHHEKTYDIKYTGKERAYRLQPLWKIQSPHPGGARSCDYTLTPIRPDGERGEAWSGHYETPAPEGAPPKPATATSE
jgi:hypothetical protein